jgi:tetratricopeptide (TPR) repeat protein
MREIRQRSGVTNLTALTEERNTMKPSHLLTLISATILVVGWMHPAGAQHSSEVQKLSAEGEHMKALAMYELLPNKKVVTEARIAAAKSAWALGLNRQAADGFDAILRDPTIAPDIRTRLVLSRGVIEYQEERYQEASLYAEKAIGYMQESAPLRGRAYLLWGQSLLRTAAYSSALEKFQKALVDVSAQDKPEAHFALGLVELKLGRYTESQKDLEAIPMDHVRTPVAVRMLAALALETHQYDRATFWIEKGQADHPETFVDSWGDYGLVQAAIAKGNLEDARRVVDRAQKQFAPSDSWLVLMQASLEMAEWKKRDSGTTVG